MKTPIMTKLAVAAFAAMITLGSKAAAPTLVSPANNATNAVHFTTKGPYGKLARSTYLKADAETRQKYGLLNQDNGTYSAYSEAMSDLRYADTSTRDNFASPGQPTNTLSWTGSAPF